MQPVSFAAMTFPLKLVRRILVKLSQGGEWMARKRYNKEAERLIQNVIAISDGVAAIKSSQSNHIRQWHKFVAQLSDKGIFQITV